MVLVLNSGSVRQRMLTLAEPVPQQKLGEAAQRVNEMCANFSAQQVRLKSINLPMLEREVAELTAELIERADNNQVRFIYRDGLSRMMENFADEEGAQQAIRILEEHTVLNALVNELLERLPAENSDELNVQVVIAGDGRYEDLSRLSMVLGRYGDPEKMSGAIGVLGSDAYQLRTRHQHRALCFQLDDQCAGNPLSGQPGRPPERQHIIFIRIAIAYTNLVILRYA